ncbi:MAG: hypothetical protein ACR2JF_05115 [Iamia sp.]
MKIARIVSVVILVLTDLLVGVWAGFLPQSFYNDFPGNGRVWVAVDGPFNEHLTRDVGTLYLGLAAIGIVALLARSKILTGAFGLGSLVFGLPHLVYHLRHTDLLDTSDNVLNLTGLGLAVVAAVLAMTAVLDGPEPDHADDDHPARRA